MKPCWCKFLLGLLVIVFAWWQIDWTQWILTILGLIIAITSLFGMCCCQGKCNCETLKEEKVEK